MDNSELEANIISTYLKRAEKHHKLRENQKVPTGDTESAVPGVITGQCFIGFSFSQNETHEIPTANDKDIALRTNHSLGDIRLSTALAITSKQAVGSFYGGEKASGKVVSDSMSASSGGFVLTAAAGRLLAD